MVCEDKGPYQTCYRGDCSSTRAADPEYQEGLEVSQSDALLPSLTVRS
jgi:hypothetical protein